MFNKMILSKTNLINNVKQVKKNNPKSKICAMVKANAYGVGLDFVVQTIQPFVDYFGVACFFEAKQVKQLTNKKILIVGPLDKNNIDESFSYTCSSLEDINFLAGLNKKLNIQIKINSGMNRFGFSQISKFKQALKIIKNSKLNLEGIFTHFATADNFINTQMEKFNKFIIVAKKYFSNFIVHADNSIVNEIKNHNLDMVRIGFDLYNKNNNTFKSIVKIKSTVVQINKVKKGELVGYDYRCVANKNIKVAIVPIGYADGFGLQYVGLNLKINNINCKVLNVCMDCFMLDVSKLKIKKGDEVYLLNENNTIAKYSIYSKISEYQVMTNFSNIRAERVIEN